MSYTHTAPKRMSGRSWRTLCALIHEGNPPCYLCGKPIIHGLRPRHPQGPSVDHVNNCRWDNRLENLAPAHLSCNVRKENARRRRAKQNKLNAGRQW